MSQTIYYNDVLRRVVEYVRLSNVTSTEYQDAIGDAYREYWNLINEVSQNYNLKTDSFVTDGSTALYTLAPTDGDFLKLRGLDYDPSGDTSQSSLQRISIPVMSWAERNKYRSCPIFGSAMTGWGLRYMLWGTDQVLLQPLPTGSLTIVYYYWPVPPAFVSGGSTNGVNGLDVYISSRAAKSILDARKIPSSWLDMKIQGFVDLLKTTADDINRDEPPRCQDIYAKSSGWYW